MWAHCGAQGVAGSEGGLDRLFRQSSSSRGSMDSSSVSWATMLSSASLRPDKPAQPPCGCQLAVAHPELPELCTGWLCAAWPSSATAVVDRPRPAARV